MPNAIVHVIDDDTRLLKALSRLLSAHGYRVATYSSASEFLDQTLPSVPACVLLDYQMPGMSGVELQQVLAQRDLNLPIVFLSGRGDIPLAVEALKQGAIDFLTKPVEEDILIGSIQSALMRSREERARQEKFKKDRAAFESLSQRERQVCIQVADGKLNKQIAGDFGTTEKTIKAQRGQVMRKLHVGSVAELVKLVERLRSLDQLPQVRPLHSPQDGNSGKIA
jgi:FixJ family two-component response regulator